MRLGVYRGVSAGILLGVAASSPDIKHPLPPNFKFVIAGFNRNVIHIRGEEKVRRGDELCLGVSQDGLAVQAVVLLALRPLWLCLLRQAGYPVSLSWQRVWG